MIRSAREEFKCINIEGNETLHKSIFFERYYACKCTRVYMCVRRCVDRKKKMKKKKKKKKKMEMMMIKKKKK